MKKLLSMLLVLAMLLSMTACGKSEAAENADNLILAIGTVSLNSEDSIVAAEQAYAALKDKDKEAVENYDTLTGARAEYDRLVVENNTKLAKEAAADIDAKIDAIGKVTRDSAEQIKEVRSAYNAANSEAKGYVTKLDALTAAEATLKQLNDDYVAAALKKMTMYDDVVQGVKWYYPKAFPYYHAQGYWGADVRSFVLPYMGVEGNSVWLRLVCDYTADSWIFFEKITFAIDDERIYKTFSYYDVTRDNAWGDIWEYVDLEVGASEIELLTKIANSKTTIVRFEGDNYYDDITISQQDKAAIKEMLAVYEAMK